MIKEKKEEGYLIFIAVLFSSMTGAAFYGISLNKVALIPLEIYLLRKYINTPKGLNRMQIILLAWYVASMLSAVFGMFDVEITGTSTYQKSMILYIFQTLFIYIPILLFGSHISLPWKRLKRAIILVAKINAVWAISQFVTWELFSFDLNSFFFGTVLRGSLGDAWTVWSYEMGSLTLRVSGLNHDTAFMVMILVPGFLFAKSFVWKFVFFSATILSLSRTGIFIIGFAVAIQFLCSVDWRHLSKRIVSFVIFFSVIGVIFVAVIILCSESIRYQISYAVFRISNIFDSDRDVGTSRHLMYIPFSIFIWALYLDVFRKLFGVGPRCGGIALSLSEETMKYGIPGGGNAWAIECDYAELLLGHGILGFIIYYFLFAVIKEKKDVTITVYVITLCLMGIMYNFLDNTFIQLIFIFLSFSEKRGCIKLNEQNCGHSC